MLSPDEFERLYGDAYRRAVAAANERAMPGYEAGSLPRRQLLDTRERGRDAAIQLASGFALMAEQISGRAKGELGRRMASGFAQAALKTWSESLDPDEEARRRWAARP